MSDAKPDTFNLYFRERHGAPAGWMWVSLDASPEAAPEGYAKVTGAVCPPRKGHPGLPDWKNRDRTTERSFVFDVDDLRRFERELAEREGKCHQCWGAGRELESFGVHGKRTRTCHACNGTGKPAAARNPGRSMADAGAAAAAALATTNKE